MRSVVGFDPRPPHAGWTPKEEVDDDEQTRELLAGGGGDGRSPADSHLSLMHSPVGALICVQVVCTPSDRHEYTGGDPR